MLPFQEDLCRCLARVLLGDARECYWVQPTMETLCISVALQVKSCGSCEATTLSFRSELGKQSGYGELTEEGKNRKILRRNSVMHPTPFLAETSQTASPLSGRPLQVPLMSCDWYWLTVPPGSEGLWRRESCPTELGR